jgi:endo-1,4-beta-xylanase
VKASRRSLISGMAASALCACSDGVESRSAAIGQAPSAAPLASPVAPPADAPAFKTCAPFPVGNTISTDNLADPALVALFLKHFNQATPEWEMKMERILKKDGTLDFSAADRIADFLKANGVALHGTTLVWYDQSPDYLLRLADDRRAFEQAFDAYVRAVVGRYRGLARGWDVLNEAVAENGRGFRGGVFEKVMGPDYARRAFAVAREADPDAVLFVNDYNLESIPAKLDNFQRLIEGLLKSGAPVTGIGTQSHLQIDLARGEYARMIQALARFGLPIHVSELTISLRLSGAANGAGDQWLAAQARLMDEVCEAFLDLPAPQRYAFTVWGVRDRDSFLRRPPNAGDGTDRPLMFDDQGRPKPALFAAEKRFASAPRS